MLCSKCGYISFDHLSTCAKCNNDLSGALSEINGTTADIEQGFFLSSVVAGNEAGNAEVSATDESLPEPLTYAADNDDDAIEAGQDVDDNLEEAEAVADEGVDGELELDFAEMAPLDLSGIEPDEEEGGGLEPEDGEEEELALPDEPEEGEAHGVETVSDEESPAEDGVVSLKEESSLAGEDLVEDEGTSEEGDGIEFDVADLSLEVDENSTSEEPDLEAASGGGDGAQGDLSIDLDQIDLSDLVHSSDEPNEKNDDTKENIVLDLGEDGEADPAGQDLSLELEEDTDPLSLTGEDVVDLDLPVEADGDGADMLGAVDLTLDDGSLVDLSVASHEVEDNEDLSPDAGVNDLMDLSLVDDGE